MRCHRRMSARTCTLGAPAVEWNVTVGDAVYTGDVVATLEAAKPTVEVDAPKSGVVLDVRFAKGDETTATWPTTAQSAAGVRIVVAGLRERAGGPRPRARRHR